MTTRQDEIIDQGILDIVEKIDREARKSAAQLAEELRQQQLTNRLSKITAQLAPLQKFPSKYKAEIQALTAEMDSIIRAEELAHLARGGKAQQDWQTAGNRAHFIFPGGKILE